MRKVFLLAIWAASAATTGCAHLCQDGVSMSAFAAASPCTLRSTKTTTMMPTVATHWTLGVGYLPIPFLMPRQISTIEMVPVPDGAGGYLQGAAAATAQTTCQTQCQTNYAVAQAPSMYVSSPPPLALSAPPPPTFFGPSGPANPLPSQAVSPGGPRAAPMPEGGQIQPLPPLK